MSVSKLDKHTFSVLGVCQILFNANNPADEKDALYRAYKCDAAEDMYSALQMIERQLVMDGHATRWESGPTHVLATVRAALAKAEGRG